MCEEVSDELNVRVPAPARLEAWPLRVRRVHAWSTFFADRCLQRPMNEVYCDAYTD